MNSLGDSILPAPVTPDYDPTTAPSPKQRTPPIFSKQLVPFDSSSTTGPSNAFIDPEYTTTRPSVILTNETDPKYKTVLIMGPTGAGKSTFINAVCGSSLAVGNGLASCTHHPDQASFQAEDGTIVQLIDTPGFDDSARSDVEILQEIAYSLQAMYEAGKDIHGIVYMHRISDQRMSGSARREFSTFLNICGPSVMHKVVIVTNMWGLVPPAIGEDRETELKEDSLFFKSAIDRGARLYRNDDPPQSGLDIISKISRDQPVYLAIQKELSDEDKPLFETTAGQELDRELTQQRAVHEAELAKLHQDHTEALQLADIEAREELEEEMALTRERMEKMKVSAMRLQERKQARTPLRVENKTVRRNHGREEHPAHRVQRLLPQGREDGAQRGPLPVEQVGWARHRRESLRSLPDTKRAESIVIFLQRLGMVVIRAIGFMQDEPQPRAGIQGRR